MCKIFAMTNMEKVNLTSKFINTVKNEVCRLSDKDGFGYAVLGANGKLGGERTIRPATFSALSNKSGKKMVSELPIVLKSSNSFGKIDLLNPKMFIAHGRFSTNDKTLQNTHPFINDNVAMIHNGVVQDAEDKIKNLLTTCDSEILLRYWELGGIKEIEKNVTGYYAIAMLDKQGRMHIARDNRAMLYMSYCRTVDSYIIATTVDIIKNVAKTMKWNIETPEEMLPNIYAIFEQNNIVSHETISPRVDTSYGRWDSFNEKARAAFGGNDYSNVISTAKALVHKESYPEMESVPSYREEYYGKEYYDKDLADDDAPEDDEQVDTVTMIGEYAKTRKLVR